MRPRLKIDGSYSCQMRTSGVIVTARSTLDPPQLLLVNPLPGRRYMKILHFGKQGDPDTNVRLVIGDQDVRWIDATDDIWGFELNHFEFVDLEVDESVDIYVVLSDIVPAMTFADLRILEIA